MQARLRKHRELSSVVVAAAAVRCAGGTKSHTGNLAGHCIQVAGWTHLLGGHPCIQVAGWSHLLTLTSPAHTAHTACQNGPHPRSAGTQASPPPFTYLRAIMDCTQYQPGTQAPSPPPHLRAIMDCTRRDDIEPALMLLVA